MVFAGVGGEGDDPEVALVGAGVARANFRDGGEAVQLGHVEIHEHEVGVVARKPVEGDATVFGGGPAATEVGDDFLDEALVDGVVFDDEHVEVVALDFTFRGGRWAGRGGREGGSCGGELARSGEQAAQHVVVQRLVQNVAKVGAKGVAEFAGKDDGDERDDFLRRETGARRVLERQVHGGGACDVDDGEIPIVGGGEGGFFAVDDGGAEAFAETREFFAQGAAECGDGESLAAEGLG